jgi:Protein of unknown function (DUF3455)
LGLMKLCQCWRCNKNKTIQTIQSKLICTQLQGINMKILTTIALVLSSLLLAACASKPSTGASMAAKVISVPATIKVAESEQLAFVWGAKGTQNYECKANTAGAMAWAFVAPEAQLLDGNTQVGTHGAGPFWMALDGSKTIGAVKARADAPNGKDIPWLLLTMKSAGTPGKLANITSIQRFNTVGGIASSTGCAVAADAGKQSKIAYTADYAFFVAK